VKDPDRTAAGLAGAALAVGLASSGGPGRELDRRLFRAANLPRGAVADALFRGVTELGSIWGSLGAAAMLWRSGRPSSARRAMAAAGTAWLVGQGLKRAFRRPRPYDALEPGSSRLLIGKPAGTSWPSSHPMVLLAFLTVVEGELDVTVPIRAAGLVLAGMVGVSRSYLGVHFPSDVAGGLLLGRALGLAWPSEPAGRR
jgi:undecaprenyl-diphosphatase